MPWLVPTVVEWRHQHQQFAASRRPRVCYLPDLDGDTLYFVRVIAMEEGLRDANPSRTVSITTPAGSARPFLRGWRLGFSLSPRQRRVHPGPDYRRYSPYPFRPTSAANPGASADRRSSCSLTRSR